MIFTIAEIGQAHDGSLGLAHAFIDAVAKTGCSAIKFQTHIAQAESSIHEPFRIQFSKQDETRMDYWKRMEFTLEQWRELKTHCDEVGLEFMSSPFSNAAVDVLEEVGVKRYKVGSGEVNNFVLLEKIAKTGKPIIISTGAASLDEIDESYNHAIKCGAKDITLMYCVSNYPSKNSDFNLNNIKILKKKFNCKIGFSDHSKDNRIAIAAVAAGAEFVEKHIALDRQKKGFDIDFSLKGKEIKQFRQDIDLAGALFNKKYFFRNHSEIKSRIHRRSIFISRNIIKGEKFTDDNIKRIRPGYGLEPKYYEKILNRKSPMNLFKGEPLKKNILLKLKIK